MKYGTSRTRCAGLGSFYGHTVARDFTTLSLDTIRQAMIDADLCRNRINKDVARIRRMFRWAGAKRLIPAAVFHELATLEGLRAGRSEAKETKPVGPVAVEVVNATLPWLPEIVADMVRIQMESGMRSAELLSMRTCDIDRSGAIWSYRPRTHKTVHHGFARTIWLGPRCQEIVRKYLKADREAHLFSPDESMRRFREKQRAERKTKVQPSQEDRTKKRPKKQPRDRNDPASYGASIRRAIQRANEAAEKSDAKKIPHWHPHQLRHLCATRIRKEFDLDTARAVLGHRSPVVTEVYMELDASKAAAVMSKIG